MQELIKYTDPLPTAEEMRHWDGATITNKYAIPEFTLMENAARAALHVLIHEYGPVQGAYVLLLMGHGNNGGDAACLARHLLDAGAKPLVLHVKALGAYRGTTGKHARLARQCGVPFKHLPLTEKSTESIDWYHVLQELLSNRPLPSPWLRPHIIVDGLLGTGFSGQLRSHMRRLIESIENFFLANTYEEHKKNTSRPFVLALDTPSGLDSLHGIPCPIALKAHATICFAAAKPGLVLPSARQYTGSLHVKSIGIPIKVQSDHAPSFRLLTSASMAKLIAKPQAQSHKGILGHVVVLGGSQGLTGAANLTSLTALRTGAALVTAAAPAELCQEIKQGSPNIMTLALTEKHAQSNEINGTTWPTNLPKSLRELLSKATALAVGPGMGRHAVAFLHALLDYDARPRAVFDADALNILADNPHLLPLLRAGDVATPHPGEAARLLHCNTAVIQKNRPKALQTLARLNPEVTWILKGAGSLMAPGITTAFTRNGNVNMSHEQEDKKPIFILPYDIPTLSVGGSGDVLTGCIAALLARQDTDKGHILSSPCAAALGMALHAATGYTTLTHFPHGGHFASDLAHGIAQALSHVSNLGELLPEIYSADIYS